MVDLSKITKEEFLRDLKALIDNTDKVINDACSYLEWDLEKIKEKHQRYITCPFNEGHWMPKESLEKHLQSCEWTALGYTKDCVPLTESFLPPDNPSSLKFDAELQQKVLNEAKKKDPHSNISVNERFAPQTSDRLFSDFTTDERRAMYDYVVANTVAPDIGKDIADINNPSETTGDKQSKTMVELLAQERNLKRRRAKYKGVHTNKKSHTEILREIIEQQLEMFKEHIAEKHGTSFVDDIKKDDFRKAENRSISSEKKTHRAPEQSNHGSRPSRFHDQYPSPRREQQDRPKDHSKSHRDQCYKSSQGHHSRDRHRHYHGNDEDYGSFQNNKSDPKTDRGRERNDSRNSRDVSNGRDKHEKNEKERKSHKREEKHDKHKHAKHKHRSRSRSRSKNKKKDKKRDRSRSKNKDHKKHRNSSRTRSPKTSI